jgi:hypothetical protein
MAGAIDDNCLNTEFSEAATKIGAISVLASKKDTVLADLFPLGNLIGGIIAEGHPWWRGALGRYGPSPPPPPSIAIPTYVPENGSPRPANGAGWQEAWSAAFVSTQFR